MIPTNAAEGLRSISRMIQRAPNFMSAFCFKAQICKSSIISDGSESEKKPQTSRLCIRMRKWIELIMPLKGLVGMANA
jgi:hypothetical protein